MLSGISLHEIATEKHLMLDWCTGGVRLFLRNDANGERIHMDLNQEDIQRVVEVLQQRLQELSEE